MIFGNGLALILGAWAFYLFDTLLMLYSDEIVMVRSGRGWHAVLGGEAMLGGRYPALPALLAPANAVFRVTSTRSATANSINTAAMLRHLAPVRLLASLQLVLVLGVMPAGVLAHASPRPMLTLLVAVYATSVAIAAVIVMRRKIFCMRGHALRSLLVDVLACPPFAINAVRRITLGLTPPAPAPKLMCRVLPNADSTRLLKRVELRLALRHNSATEEPL